MTGIVNVVVLIPLPIVGASRNKPKVPVWPFSIDLAIANVAYPCCPDAPIIPEPKEPLITRLTVPLP